MIDDDLINLILEFKEDLAMHGIYIVDDRERIHNKEHAPSCETTPPTEDSTSTER